MGELTEFDVDKYINKYNLKIYFETGTGKSVSLSYALRYNFEYFYSVDIDKEFIEDARNKFNNSNLILIHNYSHLALKEYIPQIDKNKPILFFLDAHFPGADFHKITYEESLRKFLSDSLPLEKEINIITSLRNTSNDVFIIDDFMLYDNNNDYKAKKDGHIWKYKWLQDELNLPTDPKFIYDTFSSTHELNIDIRSQGYLIITPKEKK